MFVVDAVDENVDEKSHQSKICDHNIDLSKLEDGSNYTKGA